MSTGFGQLPLRLRRRYSILFIQYGRNNSSSSDFGVSLYAKIAVAVRDEKSANSAIIVL